MGFLIGANPLDVFTATDIPQGKAFSLGDRFIDQAGNEYVFVEYGTGGATANFAVTIKADFSAVMTTSTLSLRGEQVGVAQNAASATDRGWAMIYGRTNIQSEVAVANAAMATTATAGTVDDAAGVGTKQILGLVLTTARASTAGLAPALLTYPVIGPTN